MSTLRHSRDRLRAVIREVDHLMDGEFPYIYSRYALDELAQIFRGKLAQLEAVDESNDAAAINQECSQTLLAIFNYLPVLGFILRSTNVRNAFEVFRPLLRLARGILEPITDPENQQTQLLLSSEWDYSPFTYLEIADLPRFVLIGLPAPESENPLLIPLAGHELGHSLWRQRYGRSMMTTIDKMVLSTVQSRWKEYKAAFPFLKITKKELAQNLFAVETWAKARAWAVRQVEETFCDFVGLCIFREAYLNAFAYLLAPTIPGPRSPSYPTMCRRVRNLVSVCRRLKIGVDLGYESLFDDAVSAGMMTGDEFQLNIADNVCDKLVGELVKKAIAAIPAEFRARATKSEIERIRRRLELGVPAESCNSIADILNAGKICQSDKTLWTDTNLESDRDRILRELLLKNIEIFSIEQILREKT